MKIILIFLLIFQLWLEPVLAGELNQRLASFPLWNNKPRVNIPQGELIYPPWMEGIWEVTSTLVQQIAPLAPEIVTPGFAQNQKYLQQPIQFRVKFQADYLADSTLLPRAIPPQLPIIADRAFNGWNIAEAYLGKDAVTTVKVNPSNPNEQITVLANQSQLITKVTGRNTELVDESRFIATEIAQQIFRSPTQVYLNEVETTSVYQLISPTEITGEQITAIYLSSQDPDYFRVVNRPVALYRYRLQLRKVA